MTNEQRIIRVLMAVLFAVCCFGFFAAFRHLGSPELRYSLAGAITTLVSGSLLVKAFQSRSA